jgi:hypothetical protein
MLRQSNRRAILATREGGLSVCMADGSVRWISDFIQVDPSSDGALSVWDRLIVSKDGLVLDSAAY